MDKKLMDDLRAKKPVTRAGCSNLYRYLRENFAILEAAGYGLPGGPSVAELTERLTRAGQVNRDGRPLQRRAVHEVFSRVRRDFAAEREAKAAAAKFDTRGGQPSSRVVKSSQAWRPIPVGAKPASSPTQSGSSPPFTPTTDKPREGKQDATTRLDMLDELFADFDKRSGR